MKHNDSKINNKENLNLMKKNGIILMMTLILITVMMGIVALVLRESSHLSGLGKRSFSQAASLAIIDDLDHLLPSLLSSLNGAEELDLAMRLPIQLASKKGDFDLNMRLSSPYTKMNINQLADSNGTLNEKYHAAWMRIFERYPIVDRETLLMVVLDTLDNDLTERSTKTEIKWRENDFNNGSIMSMKQFDRILQRYLTLTKDKTILSIPWENYIGFEGDKIDLNAVNPETLTLLLPGVSAEKIRQMTQYRTKTFVSKEEAIASEPLLAGVFDDFFFIYKKELKYDLVCDLQLIENGNTEPITFQYGLLEKKIKRVEF
jgi:hypothetical protein